MKNITQQEIESIEFNEIGGFPYKLIKVEVSHPMQNVNGLIQINGSYYTKDFYMHTNATVNEESLKGMRSR